MPANLGLLSSRDDGRTWAYVSLPGKADLHLLQPTRSGLWALDIATRSIAITDDGADHSGSDGADHSGDGVDHSGDTQVADNSGGGGDYGGGGGGDDGGGGDYA